MTDNKKPGVDPKVDENTQIQTPIADQASSEERRRAVKNILAGSGVVAGAAATSQWSKPIIDAVMLPAHAQTSGPVTLVGNVSITPVVNNKQPSATDVLDFFIGTANAGNAPSAPDLAGSCMTMMVDSTSFDLLVEFASAPSINVPGTVSNGAMSGSNSGVSVTGNVDLGSTPPTAMGQISNGSGMFNFMLDDSQTNCSPIEVTTTPEPTTTCDSGYAFNTSTGYCEYVGTPPTSPTTTVAPPTSPTTTAPPPT